LSFHNRIRRSIKIEGVIIVKDPLVIASGDSKKNIADLTPYIVPIKGVDVPCIPGSSLKGVIRSEVEYLLKEAHKDHSGIDCCNIIDYRNSCGGKNNRRIQRIMKDTRRNEELESILSKFCYACQLFGSPNYKGRVRLSDSFPVDNYSSYNLEKLHGIAIDRLSGENSPGSLYSIQYISPGSIFSFRLSGINLTTQQIGLLFASLYRLHWGYRRLGGFGTKGFGKIKLNLNRVSLGKKKINGDFSEIPSLREAPNSDSEIDTYTKNTLNKLRGLWYDFLKGGVTNRA